MRIGPKKERDPLALAALASWGHVAQGCYHVSSYHVNMSSYPVNNSGAPHGGAALGLRRQRRRR